MFDDATKKRSNVLSILLENKNTSKVINEALNAPLRSPARKKAKNLISIINKTTPSRYQGQGGAFDFGSKSSGFTLPDGSSPFDDPSFLTDIRPKTGQSNNFTQPDYGSNKTVPNSQQLDYNFLKDEVKAGDLFKQPKQVKVYSIAPKDESPLLISDLNNDKSAFLPQPENIFKNQKNNDFNIQGNTSNTSQNAAQFGPPKPATDQQKLKQDPKTGFYVQTSDPNSTSTTTTTTDIYGIGSDDGGYTNGLDILKGLPELEGIPVDRGATGFALAYMDKHLGGNNLSQIQETFRKKLREEHHLNQMADSILEKQKRGALLQGDIENYIRGKDQYIKTINDDVNSLNEKLYAGGGATNPFMKKLAKNYTAYLSTLKGRALSRYDNIVRQSVDQFSAEQNALNQTYQNILQEYTSELNNGLAASKETYINRINALKEWYNKMDNLEAKQIALAKARADVDATTAKNLKSLADAHAKLTSGSSDSTKLTTNFDDIEAFKKRISRNGTLDPTLDIAQLAVDAGTKYTPRVMASAIKEVYEDSVIPPANASQEAKKQITANIPDQTKMALTQLTKLKMIVEQNGDAEQAKYIDSLLKAIQQQYNEAMLPTIKNTLTAGADGDDGSIQNLFQTSYFRSILENDNLYGDWKKGFLEKIGDKKIGSQILENIDNVRELALRHGLSGEELTQSIKHSLFGDKDFDLDKKTPEEIADAMATNVKISLL